MRCFCSLKTSRKVHEIATVKKAVIKPPPAEPVVDPPLASPFIEKFQLPFITMSRSDLKNKMTGIKKIAAIIKLIKTGTRFIKTASFQRPRSIRFASSFNSPLVFIHFPSSYQDKQSITKKCKKKK